MQWTQSPTPAPSIPLLLAAAMFGCAPAVQPAERAVALAGPPAAGMQEVFSANQAALESARFVVERASHPAVRQLAGDLVRQHEDTQQRLERLLSDRGVHPPPEEVAADAVRAAPEWTDARPALADRRGMSLDRAYLEYQRRYSLWLAETLEGALLGLTADPGRHALYSAMLAETREGVEAIEQLRARLIGWHN